MVHSQSRLQHQPGPCPPASFTHHRSASLGRSTHQRRAKEDTVTVRTLLAYRQFMCHRNPLRESAIQQCTLTVTAACAPPPPHHSLKPCSCSICAARGASKSSPLTASQVQTRRNSGEQGEVTITMCYRNLQALPCIIYHERCHGLCASTTSLTAVISFYARCTLG